MVRKFNFFPFFPSFQHAVDVYLEVKIKKSRDFPGLATIYPYCGLLEETFYHGSRLGNPGQFFNAPHERQYANEAKVIIKID